VSALAFISIWLFFSGIANGLSENLNHQTWLGNTMVGGFLLLCIGIVIKVTLVKIKRGSLKRKAKEYERQLHEQQSKFGHSVVEQATAGTEN
jgi:high-affinity nickel permease